MTKPNQALRPAFIGVPPKNEKGAMSAPTSAEYNPVPHIVAVRSLAALQCDHIAGEFARTAPARERADPNVVQLALNEP